MLLWGVICESETDQTYRAPFFEYTDTELESLDLQTVLSKFIPANFEFKDLVVRIIRLPDKPQKRQKRVQEISEKGTDRTGRWHPSNLGSLTDIGAQYEKAAREGETNPQNVLLCLQGESFRDVAEKYGISEAIRDLGKGKTNAILVYDAKTGSGVEKINTIYFKFRNPTNKPKALLGVIAIKQ